MFQKDQNFSYFDYEQLTKDLCYNKPLSFHFETQNQKTKFQFDELIEVKSGKCSLADIIHFRHQLAPNKILKSALGINSMKIQYGYELGKEPTHNSESESTIVYSRLHSDRKLQNASVQFGVDKKSPHLKIDANVSVFLYERQNQYFLYSKLLYLSKKFNVGLLSIFDCGGKNLQTNNVVLQLKPHEKHQLFLRGEVDGLRNYFLKYSKLRNYFDYLILDYIARPTETLTLMAEVKYDLETRRIKNMQSIIEKKFPQNKLKFGINQLADLTFQMSFPLTVGRSSTLDFGVQIADIFKSRKISYGFRVNINS